MLEAVLQRLILARLGALEGVYAWRANTGGAQTMSGRSVRFGVKGQADVMAIVNGRFFAVEVKSDIGKPTKDQLEWGKRVKAAGGKYIVARTLMEALGPVLVELAREEDGE